MQQKDPLLRSTARICVGLPDQRVQYERTIEQRCDLLIRELRGLEVQWRLLRKARYRRWHCATRKLSATIARIAERSEWQARTLRSTFDTKAPSRPTYRDIYLELQQLGDEFADSRVTSAPLTLVATTESIDLDGIELGRFAIRLEIESSFDGSIDRCLRITALDPNPAANHPHVTHPHVSDERLCPGDAALPMTNALQAGRFADVLLLARSVLETYNDASPYVTLENWCGLPCRECGVVCDSEEIICCRGCDEDFCDDCLYTCEHCSTSVCGQCSASCAACDSHHCEHCLTNCEDCGDACCPSCLTDTCCEPCTEQREENTNETETQTEQAENKVPRTGTAETSTAAASPLHADRVGEAALPLPQG